MKKTFLLLLILSHNILYSQSNIDILYEAIQKADSGFHDEAIKMYNNLILQNPKMTAVYYHRAVSLEQVGDTVTAINDYKIFLKRYRFDSDAHINIAFLYAHTNNKDYKKHMNRAVRYSRKETYYRLNRGILNYLIGDYKKANKDFNKTLHLLNRRTFVSEDGSFSNENSHHAYYYKALIYYEVDRLTEALEFANAAIELLNTNAKCYFLRGYINLELENNEDACFDFTQAAHYGYEDAYSEIAEYCF